ncbi:MAG TPA: benzoate/H(+) symporter BenE family transporter [Burkholderiaceae bacterium]|nr:benzoate/H(+) symporter BenE family transporter [Burkholderiaceae bacterium]
MMGALRQDFSLSAAVAGLIALLATYSGPVLIVVQAAQAGHLSLELLSTWIWALSVGAAALGLYLSLRYRIPVIGAWSTPGVALLIGALGQYPFSDVIGCYLALAVAVTLLAWSGLFARLMKWLPANLLSAMIAGVLFQFCTKVFQALQGAPQLVLPVVLTYLLCRRFIPRYAVALALLSGLLLAWSQPALEHGGVALTLVRPVVTMPTFSATALLGLGLPLLLLALTQYATGLTILSNAGYEVTARTIVGVSGLVSMPLALCGSSGINPAAIVGALCASSECHADPRRRYIAGVVCGVGYLCVGIFGASVVALFALLPAGLIATLAGLALLGTLVSSLTASLADETKREASLITFVVTVSGMSFWGLGSALWGLLAGLLFTYVLSWSGLRGAAMTSNKGVVR